MIVVTIRINFNLNEEQEQSEVEEHSLLADHISLIKMKKSIISIY